ncbi:phosphate transporter [Papiliotrema laurentii]|uniref:Phosphate transporter n=1 Tax=Papiliotrema laurentii TaxID=5418 RepID=A0AAD9L936_PAPLA|nr:phosphate transporter [Papiliotrema laurentii]
MAALPQWDYIFVIALLFAALDAYNIGANDVANSFATSVSSRSLSLRQACFLAAICEFLGAVLVGAKVAGTIKNSIISLDVFEGNAGVAMLAFTCALVASATWLMIATKNSWPVSTTYSLVSALAGVGVAVGGWDAPNWGWNGSKGLGAIWAGMGIAPAISAGFAATVYLITKFAVLDRENSIKKALMISPIYFFTVTAVLTMSIVYKGSPELKLDKLPGTTIALAIVLTSLVISILSMIFWLPYVYVKVVRKDHTIRWYHFFYGPLLWKRPAPEVDENAQFVPDYRVRDRDTPAKPVQPGSATASNSGDVETKSDPEAGSVGQSNESQIPATQAPLEEVEKDEHKIEGYWWTPKNLYIIFRYKIIQGLLHGSSVDIHKMQTEGGSAAANARLAKMHERSNQYPNETEHLYSFLQVLTACTNSFAHGANDVSNAIGPFAAVYYIWQNGTFGKNTPTPTWILAFGGAMIVIGLATYGYKIMAAIGNRITLMSPSRGFSMELGASITVLLASQYGIPVSTTMCIIGATIGVGVVSSGPAGVNWRAIGWVFLGWVLTVPIAGISAGCLMGIILNAPHF